MGEPTGFINWKRTTPKRRSIPVRVADWREVYEAFPAVDLKRVDAWIAAFRFAITDVHLAT